MNIPTEADKALAEILFNADRWESETELLQIIADHTAAAVAPLALAPCSPPLEIEIEVRNARPPYETWPATGHLPFEMHGERFAVTHIPCALRDEEQWRATHIETGVAVPLTGAATKEEVPEKTKAVLAEFGPQKLKAALAKVKALFPANTKMSRGALR